MSTLNPVHVRNFVQQIAQKFDDGKTEAELKVINLLPKLVLHSEANGKTLQKERIQHINTSLKDWNISLRFMEEREGLTAEDKYFTHVFAQAWLKFSNQEKTAIISQIQQAGIKIDSIPTGRIISYQMSHVYKNVGLLGVKPLLLLLKLFGPDFSPWLRSLIYPRVVSLSKRLVENYASNDIKVRGELAYQTAKKVAEYVTSTQFWKTMNYQFLGRLSLMWILGSLALIGLNQISPIFPAIYYAAECDILSFINLILSESINLANGFLYESLIKNISDRKEAITAIKAYKVFMECVKNYPPEPRTLHDQGSEETQ